MKCLFVSLICLWISSCEEKNYTIQEVATSTEIKNNQPKEDENHPIDVLNDTIEIGTNQQNVDSVSTEEKDSIIED